MIYDNKKAPYIRNKFTVERSTFSNQIIVGAVSAKVSSSLQGQNAGLKINEVIKPAIGEFIERQSLFYNYKSSKDNMKAFRLITGEEASFPAGDIVFARGAEFSDSCGVASHLNSKQAIESAFLEFFERQSYIFNWLTKSSGKLIDLDSFNNEYIANYSHTLNQFVDKLYLFEISLDPTIKVVFGLGIGIYHKIAGLSAAFTIEEAIASTLQEMVQGASYKHNKNNVDYYEDNFDYGDDVDYYFENFEKYNPQQLIAEYAYLFKDNRKFANVQSTPIRDLNLLIPVIENNLKIKIYCSLIPCFYKGFRTKIVKVFSPEGYPHMSPINYNDISDSVIYGKKVSDCPNFNKLVLFP
ncbi:hypothetical protein NCCP2222_12920 [Sporosarcina sp. NCCP-2222]|uniref:YcaO-like family protein n=1 Tax=Sporosarcina sp. NCCP-2222 TaxID=2935073 RepID=UPI002081259B|nr:YcaO-like family protein [Sporosarcina sp. NCCP-2222]GKV55345.1 hypothetical protein NCCP2222_12920 [Sporosarcina sp. NCCP-2222]